MVRAKQIEIDPKKIELISIARPALAPRGKNVAITFHATRAARRLGGSQLPRSITVGINGRPVEALDLTGTGSYTVFAKVAKTKIPKAPLFLARSTQPVEPLVTGSISCKTVTCEPGCKSIIFGTACIICIKCTIKFKLEG